MEAAQGDAGPLDPCGTLIGTRLVRQGFRELVLYHLL